MTTWIDTTEVLLKALETSSYEEFREAALREIARQTELIHLHSTLDKVPSYLSQYESIITRVNDLLTNQKEVNRGLRESTDPAGSAYH